MSEPMWVRKEREHDAVRLHHLKIEQTGESPVTAAVWLDGHVIHPASIQLDLDADGTATIAVITLAVRVDVDVLAHISALDRTATGDDR